MAPRDAAGRLSLKPRLAAHLSTAAGYCRSVAARVGPGVAFLALIGLWVLAHGVWALRYVTRFPGHEGDGPYQLFNPLRRIAAGQTGGVDFQYFHGLGLPYVHYPVYALAGADVYAAEFARQFVAIVVYVGTNLAVFAAATRRTTPTLVLTVLALVLGDQFNLYGLSTAGNASMGLRTATPYLILAALLAGLRPRFEAMAVGVLGGVGLVLGVEHGIAGLVMVGLVWAGRQWFRLPGRSVAWAAGVYATAGLTALGVLMAIGGPAGAAGAARYALVEMPADQFWYFGVPPNEFFFRWSDVFTDRWLVLRVAAPFAVVGVLLARRVRSRPAERPRLLPLLGFLGYGCVGVAPYFGYASIHYIEALTRVWLVLALVFAWVWWAGLEEADEPVRRNVRAALAAVVGVLLVAGPTDYESSSVIELPAAVREGRALAVDFAAGRCHTVASLQNEYDAHVAAIDADRVRKGVTRPPVVWSTYAGRIEAHYGVFHPCSDYLLHALGPARRSEYLDTFRNSRPDYVVTCRTTFFQYEEWLRNESWPFYEEVIRNYDALSVGQRFVVWVRRGDEWKSPNSDEGVAFAPDLPNGFTVPVPPGADPAWPRVVEVEYEVRNPLAGVPVGGDLPRHLIAVGQADCNTPISLPPYRTTWTFGVFPKPGETPVCFAHTFSLVGGNVTVKRVRVRSVPATQEQIDALTK